MSGRVILGGIIGAVVAFLWGFISWAVLPWHNTAINKVTNESFVAWVIKENAPKDGVYIIPRRTSDEVRESLEAGIDSKVTKEKSPFVYMQLKRNGMNFDSPRLYIVNFLTQFVGAALISALLIQSIRLRYAGRVAFVTIIGLVIGILSQMPNWNWFGASSRFAIVTIADYVITWFLAGLFLALIVKPKHVHERMM